VNELEAEATLMIGLEEQLSEIARKQGVNANEIVMLVRENEDILSKQKANLKVSSFNCIFALDCYPQCNALIYTLITIFLSTANIR
jgi:hypothetical protein